MKKILISVVLSLAAVLTVTYFIADNYRKNNTEQSKQDETTEFVNTTSDVVITDDEIILPVVTEEVTTEKATTELVTTEEVTTELVTTEEVTTEAPIGGGGFVGGGGGVIVPPQYDCSKNKHNIEIVKGTPATCTADGLTDGKKCLECKKTILPQRDIPASHTYASEITCKSRSCTKCSYVAPASSEHDMTEWIALPKNECSNVEMSVRVCRYCGYIETINGEFTDVLHPHTPVLELYIEATCTEFGRVKIVCQKCGIICCNEYASPLGHRLEIDYDENVHWEYCKRINCDFETERETHVAEDNEICTQNEICKVCGFLMREPIGHNWSTKWSYDISEHWHRCLNLCGNKNDQGVHIWQDIAGEDDKICTVCGVKYSEVTIHYHYGGAATCIKKAICEGCGEYYGSYAPHKFTEEIVKNKYFASPATCTQAERYYYSCSVCGEKGGETFPNGEPLGHDWETEWSFSGTHHWYACTRCSGSKDYDCHEGNGISCTQGGICTVCGADSDPLGHDWSNYKSSLSNEESHWKECLRESCDATSEPETHLGGTANCTERARCVVCNAYYGKVLGHLFDDTYKYDDDEHWHKCTRSGCNETKDIEEHTIVPTAEFDEVNTGTQIKYNINFYETCFCGYKNLVGQVTRAEHYGCTFLYPKEPTCTETGLTYGWKCSVPGCDEVYMPQEVIPALGHNYVNKKCTRCGKRVSQGLEFVSYGNGICYVNGIGTCTDTDVIIPEKSPDGDNVTSIGAYAFYGCSGLTSIEIPAGVTSIGGLAFYGCSGLTSVEIPASVISIGVRAFNGCRGLESITVANGNTVYHSSGNCLIESATKTLIVGCKNSLIPSDGSVTSIGDGAFDGCSGLTSIEIPEGVTSIGDGAFKYCFGLTTINYAGTEEQWNAITKGSNWDSFAGSSAPSGTYTVVYNYTKE